MNATMISEKSKTLFDREVAKYPSDQKQSAVMACLTIIQTEFGFVSAESEKLVADYLGMAPIAVHEVTTFYTMYNQKPVGKYKLNVCTNLPCQLRDGAKALKQAMTADCFWSDGYLATSRSKRVLLFSEIMVAFMRKFRV